MNVIIRNFDSELLCLRHEKIKLEIELKEASFMLLQLQSYLIGVSSSLSSS